MANTVIRLQTTFVIQIISCERINQALSECINNVNKAYNIVSPKVRFRIFPDTSERFDTLTKLHAKVYKLTRYCEEISSNLTIFSILKTFAHLSSTLFLLIDHMNSNEKQDMDFIITSGVRCFFNILDMIFIFFPVNTLKRELHKVGKIIYRGSLNKLPLGLQRSIEMFSIYLLHQKKGFMVGGIFELDNNFLYSILSAMVSYIIFFVQIKSLELEEEEKQKLFDALT
ncbi:gustatory receptor for bitter taste 93a [Contarinia nasturtii]|uniref:gustatory receptor for bitter taste 93a n=1 Tax=Contarinia nasturtii TaxID=265458 RepID=UPI0012D40688|nr:gustatory receptor for bitter taste 93a [Contarinia nasturtii]